MKTQWQVSGAAAVLALLHGAGNGILTIARGTLPLAIFGPKDYAYRLGLIGAPSRIAQALAPLGFGLLIEPMGRGVVAVSVDSESGCTYSVASLATGGSGRLKDCLIGKLSARRRYGGSRTYLLTS